MEMNDYRKVINSELQKNGFNTRFSYVPNDRKLNVDDILRINRLIELNNIRPRDSEAGSNRVL